MVDDDRRVPMNALVLYDSKHGNTEKIARAIAAGLKEGGVEPVECRALASSGEEDFRGKDLWVLGAPTHYGSLPFRFSALLKNALQEDHPGVRAAIFDTRMKDFPKGAVVKLRKILEKKNKRIIGEDSFVVNGMRGPLADGEEERAIRFGKQIAQSFLTQ